MPNCLSILLAALPLLFPGGRAEPPPEDIAAVLGAASEEEVPESEAERLQDLAGRRINVNSASRSRLMETGILSRYQVASICDYRSRCGDILSEAELGFVDGFSPELARSLASFFSFEPRHSISADTLKRSSVITGTGAGVKDKSFIDNYIIRYKLDRAENLSVRLAIKNASSAGLFKPSSYGASLQWRWFSGKLIVGDYNARFGGGLVQWSGFRIESLSTPESLSLRSSGLSQSWSATPGARKTGVCACQSFGFWTVSAFVSAASLRSWEGGADVTRLWDRSSLSVTAVSSGKISAGYSFSSSGSDFQLEAAADLLSGSGAFLSVVRGRLSDRSRYGLRLRLLPSAYRGARRGEYSAAAAFSVRTGKGSSLDAAAEAAFLPEPGVNVRRGRLKVNTSWKGDLTDDLHMEVRATFKFLDYEPPPRIGLRTDFAWKPSGWGLRCRLEGSLCPMKGGPASVGILCYAEPSFSAGGWTLYARSTVFHSSSYAARIWCYERSAPMSFSVLQYSGTGGRLSFQASYKTPFRPGKKVRWSMYAGAHLLVKKEKPAEAGLSLHFVISWVS